MNNHLAASAASFCLLRRRNPLIPAAPLWVFPYENQRRQKRDEKSSDQDHEGKETGEGGEKEGAGLMERI
jgi:hypothetical protein